jgi:hypothetical protein
MFAEAATPWEVEKALMTASRRLCAVIERAVADHISALTLTRPIS